MGKKVLAVMLLFIGINSLPVFAGDRAEFYSFGFLDEGKTYLYGEYGLQESGSLRYSELFRANADSSVVESLFYAEEDTFTHERTGNAELAFLLESAASYSVEVEEQVSLLDKGRILYEKVPGSPVSRIMQFADNSYSYTVSLIKLRESAVPEKANAFTVILYRTGPGGMQRRYEAGSLTAKLAGIYDVRLTEAIISTEGRTLVLVFQTKEYDPDSGDFHIRYLIRSMYL